MQVKLLIGHLLEIIAPIDNNDIEVDEAMISKYIQSQTDLIGNLFQTFINSCAALGDIYNNRGNEGKDINDLVEAAYHRLITNYKQIFPDPEQKTDGEFKTTLNSEMLKAWKARLDYQHQNVSKIYFIFLFDGMERECN